MNMDNLDADLPRDNGRKAVLKPARVRRAEKRPVMITGGAGFIGTNLAHRLMESGQRVLIYDNLSRSGVEHNLRWLKETHGERVQIDIADVRDQGRLSRCVGRASQIFHFAAQVAVTSSLLEPVHDFEVNVCGTINLLEALRNLESPPPLVFASTNKVYGVLEDIKLRRNGTRYEPEDPAVRRNGVDERQHLSFHSPYGCSKGAADQYVLDYARIFGLPAVTFRMSCIYGPHQLGTEDQGWVAHFLIRALEGKQITIYGDGMQVRDLLYVEDLLDAFLLTQANIDCLSGQVFNIGGGAQNTVSLMEFLDTISVLHGQRPNVRFDKWRTGDQRYYVSDTSKFSAATGWKPSTDLVTGVGRLYEWLIESRGLSSDRLGSRRRSVVKCATVNRS